MVSRIRLSITFPWPILLLKIKNDFVFTVFNGLFTVFYVKSFAFVIKNLVRFGIFREIVETIARIQSWNHGVFSWKWCIAKDCILWNENLCEIIVTKWILISVHIKRLQRWIDEISFLSFNTFRFRHQILQTYCLLWAKSRAGTNFCKNSKFNVLVLFMVEQNFEEITLDREICKHIGISIKKSQKVPMQHFAIHSVEVTRFYSYNLTFIKDYLCFYLLQSIILQIDFTKF